MSKSICLLGFGLATLMLIGCQQSPTVITTPVVETKSQGIATPEGVMITPYERPEIQRQAVATP